MECIYSWKNVISGVWFPNPMRVLPQLSTLLISDLGIWTRIKVSIASLTIRFQNTRPRLRPSPSHHHVSASSSRCRPIQPGGHHVAGALYFVDVSRSEPCVAAEFLGILGRALRTNERSRQGARREISSSPMSDGKFSSQTQATLLYTL